MKKVYLIFAFLLICVNAKCEVFALVNFDENFLENGSFDGYVMSEKLDGVRALWDGVALKSRSGKKFAAPHCFTQNFPPFALDGELYIAKNKFEETLSAVSQSKCEAWQKVKYFVFDVPNATGTLTQRLEVFESYLNALKKAQKETYPLFIIAQTPIKSKDELNKALQDTNKA